MRDATSVVGFSLDANKYKYILFFFKILFWEPNCMFCKNIIWSLWETLTRAVGIL